jgi:hypothetical protein
MIFESPSQAKSTWLQLVTCWLDYLAWLVAPSRHGSKKSTTALDSLLCIAHWCHMSKVGLSSIAAKPVRPRTAQLIAPSLTHSLNLAPITWILLVPPAHRRTPARSLARAYPLKPSPSSVRLARSSDSLSSLSSALSLPLHLFISEILR